jgi:hypothetical protein
MLPRRSSLSENRSDNGNGVNQETNSQKTPDGSHPAIVQHFELLGRNPDNFLRESAIGKLE